MSAQGGSAHGGKKISKIILFCVIFFSGFLAWGNAMAADYYVRADATGSNNGSDWANAYTALPATLDRGDSGSTYYIADGNYGGYVFDTASAANDGTKVITIKKATVAAHGTGTGWSDTYGDGQAVFQQPDDFSNSYRKFVFAIEVSYITIDGSVGSGSDISTYGFKLLQHPSYGDADNPSGYQTSFNLITLGQDVGKRTSVVAGHKFLHLALIGSGHLSCVDSDPYVCRSDGINYNFSPSEGGEFNDLEIGYVYASGFKENISLLGGSDGSIHDCYFSDNVSGPDAHGQNINIDSLDNFNIYNNIFKDSNVFCIAAHIQRGLPITNTRVYNNIFDSMTAGSTRCIASMTADSDVIWGMEVYHNNFINIDAIPVLVQTITDVAANKSYVYNNLFYSCNGVPLANTGGSPGAIVHDYNAYISSTGYTAATHNQVDTDGADPFVDLVNSDYAIDITADTANDAHVINTGLTLASPYTVDYIGTERPAGAGFDIGAYEYVGASDVVAPAAPSGLAVQ